MKLMRFGVAGAERPGVIGADGIPRDLSALVPDIAPSTMSSLLDRLSGADLAELPVILGEPRLGSPVARPGKIVAVGLNYRDHCEECGYPIPSEPILFSKAVTSLNGPNDPVVLPKGCTKADWEVEIAIVIGRRARYVAVEEARHHIAGLAVINDVTERAFQLEREGQWFKGKGCDTFAPLGPYVVTLDEIPDLADMRLWLRVNGHKMQDSSTRHMIFGIEHLVSYISQFMTLEPCDVIATGTPPGVGLGMSPQVWLKPGDVMELGVEGLGAQRQQVLAYEEERPPLHAAVPA
jgi:2-keto-4-pentenoate hydratase/2-oxohepta-3-ene-1,7-dioic acid hydratase in catechol pathway